MLTKNDLLKNIGYYFIVLDNKKVHYGVVDKSFEHDYKIRLTNGTYINGYYNVVIFNEQDFNLVKEIISKEVKYKPSAKTMMALEEATRINNTKTSEVEDTEDTVHKFDPNMEYSICLINGTMFKGYIIEVYDDGIVLNDMVHIPSANILYFKPNMNSQYE